MKLATSLVFGILVNRPKFFNWSLPFAFCVFLAFFLPLFLMLLFCVLYAAGWPTKGSCCFQEIENQLDSMSFFPLAALFSFLDF